MKNSDLKNIPGIGPNMERHLHNIGIRCVDDLKGRDPEELYRLDSLKKGFQDDRCVLYVLRCAVYYADHERHETEKLKWWYWKDKDYPETGESAFPGTDPTQNTPVKKEDAHGIKT